MFSDKHQNTQFVDREKVLYNSDTKENQRY